MRGRKGKEERERGGNQKFFLKIRVLRRREEQYLPVVVVVLQKEKEIEKISKK